MQYASQCIANNNDTFKIYEAANNAIRFTPITMQCNPIFIRSIQHNAVQCNAIGKKYNAMQFNMVQNEWIAFISDSDSLVNLVTRLPQ